MRIPPKDPAGMEQEILRNFAVPYAENTGSLPLLEKCLRCGLPVKEIVERLTGSRNTLLYDRSGRPSLMVRVPKFYLDEVLPGAEHRPHPIFSDGTDYIYLSKYQNTMEDGLAYSLPGRDIKNFINYDEALACCAEKGKGWHLMSNFEWAGLALWCRAHSLDPRGNNRYGADCARPEECGEPAAFMPDGRPSRVLTDSEPAAWSHDGTLDGIFDLNGNVAEWVGGLRMRDGKLLLLPEALDASSDAQRRGSPYWHALLPTGEPVPPDAKYALHFDYTAAPPPAGGTPAFALSDARRYRQEDYMHETPGVDETYGHMRFCDFTALSGVDVPEILRIACIFPSDEKCAPGDLYFRNNGEMAALRGGHWYHGQSAGIFWLNLAHRPEYRAERIGFRCAYLPANP